MKSLKKVKEIVKKREEMKKKLPYGIVEKEGKTIMFNRYYEAIWEKQDTYAKKLSFEKEDFSNAHTFFYNDGNPPWKDKSIFTKCIDELKKWGAYLD